LLHNCLIHSLYICALTLCLKESLCMSFFSLLESCLRIKCCHFIFLSVLFDKLFMSGLFFLNFTTFQIFWMLDFVGLSLCLPIVLLRQKGGVIFIFGTDYFFFHRLYIFVPGWPKVEFVHFISYILVDKNTS
jgi:hypothetical protein